MQAVSHSPVVSVIIPAYNAQAFIEECLGSVTAQTLKDIEAIVVDDGSTDDTCALVENIASQDERVTLLKQANQYAGVARNNGLSHATGKYLYFLDADDFIEHDAMERMVDAAETNDVDIVVARSNSHDADTHDEALIDYTIMGVSTGRVLGNEEYAGTVFQSFVGWAWDKLFRSDFIHAKKLTFQPLRTTNDAFFTYMALASASSIYCMDDVLFHHRTHNTGSLEATRRKSWECALTAIESIGAALQKLDNHGLTKRSYDNWISHFILWNVQSLEFPTAVKMLDAAYPSLESLPSEKPYYFEERDHHFVDMVQQSKSQLILTTFEDVYRIGDLQRQLDEAQGRAESLEGRIREQDREIRERDRVIREQQDRINDIYRSVSYRIGHVLISPLSIAKRVIGKRRHR